MMKKILAAVIAIVIAYFAISAFWWMFTHVFTLMWSLAKFAIVVIIALPLYIIVRRKLLS